MTWNIRVPASIANLGPGFDILALTIDLENEVTVSERSDNMILMDTGDGRGPAPASEDNLLVRAYLRAMARLRDDGPTGASFHCHNRIPMGKGLGSSAAAIVAGVLAADLLRVNTNSAPSNTDEPTAETTRNQKPETRSFHAPPRQQLVDLATEIEGHPDNVAAALLGGFVICAPGMPAQRLDVPNNLRCVILVPVTVSSTMESRTAIPTSFSREDAVFNASRIALLVRAIALNEPESLAMAMQDRWHQPYRGPLFPALDPVIGAAHEAGAYGASLSGAGPSMIALCSAAREEAVATAMVEAATSAGVAGEVLITRVRNSGATVQRVM